MMEQVPFVGWNHNLKRSSLPTTRGSCFLHLSLFGLGCLSTFTGDTGCCSSRFLMPFLGFAATAVYAGRFVDFDPYIEPKFFQGIFADTSVDRALFPDCSFAKATCPPGLRVMMAMSFACTRLAVRRPEAVQVSAERYSVSCNFQHWEYFEHAVVPSRRCPCSRSLLSTCKTRRVGQLL